MKDRVFLKSALLFLLIVTANLVVGYENDDLVFDQDGKPDEVPLIETHQEQTLFHRIKRGFFDFLKIATTTTEAPEDSTNFTYENTSHNADTVANDNQKSEKLKESAAIVGRLTRDSREDYEEVNEHDNEIDAVAEGHRVPPQYANTDDEDLAGSGEIEGSATNADRHRGREYHKHKARYYRITLTVGEPYRSEYADRNSREYKELSGNLTQALEELYKHNIPNYTHFANVVKISPTSDAFTSQVTLDIGSTFTDELEVRSILAERLRYHSLGGIQVGPEGFTFRIFQADKETAEQECDQSTELRCRSGACVPLQFRCDGVRQCDDGSDEFDCPTLRGPYDKNTHVVLETTTQSLYVGSTDEPIEPSTIKVEETQEEVTEKEYDESTLRSPSGKCRADDTVRCQDGSRYICSVQKCDGMPDCDDGGDEVGCPHPGCSAGEFACDVSRCILESQRCNFVEDCQDGSDEHDCSYPGRLSFLLARLLLTLPFSFVYVS